MNITVGKISDAARGSIIKSGGSIEPSMEPGTYMVTLPDAEYIGSSGLNVYLRLATGVILCFLRTYGIEDRSIDLCE